MADNGIGAMLSIRFILPLPPPKSDVLSSGRIVRGLRVRVQLGDRPAQAHVRKTKGDHMFSGRRLERYRQMSMRRAERRNAIRFLARLFGRRRKPE